MKKTVLKGTAACGPTTLGMAVGIRDNLKESEII